MIYIYLRKSRQNLNEDEKHRHMNILKQYVNHLKEINEKQPDKAVIPSYLCRLHQNSQTNLNTQPKKYNTPWLISNSMHWLKNKKTMG